MTPTITFLGAAQTVTGSRHLITVGDKQVLVDCGMFQGSAELRHRNREAWGFEPSRLDAVVITHAHMDHIGLLPRLVREGYPGPIYATPATCDLATVSLPDSGRIQEEDARRSRRHNPSSAAEPLYTEEEAFACLRQFQPVDYSTLTELPGGMQYQYLPAGHILGSAFASIQFETGETLLMSGDLGRYHTPLIKDPTVVEGADYLVVESTYGDRLHPKENTPEKLAELISDAAKNGTAIIVPSFAIGRTQELLYAIFELEQAGKVPSIPIYVDSPMATSVTHLFEKHKEEIDKESMVYFSRGDDPLTPKGLRFIHSSTESKELNGMDGPMMIIAGSGMATAGRIVHHLRLRLPDPSTVVLFTGYQAEGTLGRRLLEGDEQVRILGDEVLVRARIEKLNALSAHADQGEIMAWLGGFKQPPKTTFIVHGEPKVQEVLKHEITTRLGWDAVIPGPGDQFTL